MDNRGVVKMRLIFVVLVLLLVAGCAPADRIELVAESGKSDVIPFDVSSVSNYSEPALSDLRVFIESRRQSS